MAAQHKRKGTTARMARQDAAKQRALTRKIWDGNPYHAPYGWQVQQMTMLQHKLNTRVMGYAQREAIQDRINRYQQQIDMMAVEGGYKAA